MGAFHPAKPAVPFSTLIAAALLVAVSSSPADAQIKTSYQYAVKTLCTLFGDIGFGDAMAPGRYRTLINIHNPTEKKIEVARKFALAGKPGDPLGSFSVTPYKAFTLGPDQAVAYNCLDCHGADGSGAMGPSFQDGRWHFGGAPGEVFESIYQGRPDGMPAWGGRISNDQIWMLTAYVRSLSSKDLSTENFTGKTIERTGH